MLAARMRLVAEVVEAFVEVRERRAVAGEFVVGLAVDGSCWVWMSAGCGKETGVGTLPFEDDILADVN